VRCLGQGKKGFPIGWDGMPWLSSASQNGVNYRPGGMYGTGWLWEEGCLFSKQAQRLNPA